MTTRGLYDNNAIVFSDNICIGYTIGVNQYQNCKTMPINLPTSRNITLSVPVKIPSPIEIINCIINNGIIAKTTIPGKRPVIIKKSMNMPKIIKKSIKDDIIKIIGKQLRGKFDFFNKLELSINIVCDRLIILETNYQKYTPLYTRK